MNSNYKCFSNYTPQIQIYAPRDATYAHKDEQEDKHEN